MNMNRLNKKYAKISIKVRLSLFREEEVWSKMLSVREYPWQGLQNN